MEIGGSVARSRLSRPVGADLSTVDQGVSRPGLEELHEPLSDVELLDPVEEVEEAAGVDDGDLAAQAVHAFVVGVQHVACYKGRAQGDSILE